MEQFLRKIDEFLWGRDLQDMAARFVGCQIVVATLSLLGICGLIGFLAGRCK